MVAGIDCEIGQLGECKGLNPDRITDNGSLRIFQVWRGNVTFIVIKRHGKRDLCYLGQGKRNSI